MTVDLGAESSLLPLARSAHQDANTGELFATSPYDPPGTNVEPVLDSSRYFAVRIVNEQGGKATIGMGCVRLASPSDLRAAR